MYIELVKFGTTLTSRQLGKEAYLAFKPTLANIGKNEELIVDFKGVITFSPSWGDEFLTPLIKDFGDKVILKNTENISVKATLSLLEEINKTGFNYMDGIEKKETDHN